MARVLENEGVGVCDFGLTGIGPAEEPVLAVGEDAHADAAVFLGLGEVVVDLVDVFGVGVEAAGGADRAFELDEGVEGGEVDGAAGALGRWVFFDDVLGFYEAGYGEEVADGGGDVGLGLAFVVAAQDFGCGSLAAGVVWVDVEGHWVMVRARWLGCVCG